MDLFNKIPAISEDTLQYTLYLPPDLSDKASVTTFAACIRTYVDTLLPDFIWHRDAFELKVVPNPDDKSWIIEGRMRVGDCVDDEWCTVWLLKEVSSKWDIAISVIDTDGEFLLIEAAEALPAWVKPANSENRVWIYSSRLHLVPVSHISPPSRKYRRRRLPGAEDDDDDNDIDDSSEFISAKDAIGLVRNKSIDTLAPLNVENIVWHRTSGYPIAARSHVHNANAYIPTDIARALVTMPSLVQKAVEAFYTRDAIQLRAAHRMARFPPDTSVLRTIKMTRTAYAQLVGQKFFPPKAFGDWREEEGTKDWRWRDLGMKIAVGFEMLYQESKSRKDALGINPESVQSSTGAQKDALRRNPEYSKYIQNLISADYFRGELQGSTLWNALENKAAGIFVDVRREDHAKRESFAALVNIALSQTPSLSSISTSQSEEDADDWLNVDPKEFEVMLQRTAEVSKGEIKTDGMDVDASDNEGPAEDRLASEQALKLKELATKVEDFVEGEGDLEGAKFDDEGSSDDLLSDEESEPDSDSKHDLESLAARQAAMDKLVPGLEPSDYGKMPPSFHSNSQRVAPATIESDLVGEEKLPGESTMSNIQPQPQTKPIRQPILVRDHFDGVDSDDETDEEDVADEEEDEDRPQVVGDIEVDMGEEEEEFLEFSRQALGITDEQWNEIVRDRKERGAFVPASAVTYSPKKASPPTDEKPQGRAPMPGPRPNVNPNLDSFEAVMKAMDKELARSQQTPSKSAPTAKAPNSSGKGKEKAVVVDEDEDIAAAMDAELKAALDNDGDDDEEDNESEVPMDYNLIKNFLESFKSQAGLSGPVGNLAGRLQSGWQLPRDES